MFPIPFLIASPVLVLIGFGFWVWQTGAAGRRVSREHHEWQTQFREILPDFEEEDVKFDVEATVATTGTFDKGPRIRVEKRLAH